MATYNPQDSSLVEDALFGTMRALPESNSPVPSIPMPAAVQAPLQAMVSEPDAQGPMADSLGGFLLDAVRSPANAMLGRSEGVVPTVTSIDPSIYDNASPMPQAPQSTMDDMSETKQNRSPEAEAARAKGQLAADALSAKTDILDKSLVENSKVAEASRLKAEQAAMSNIDAFNKREAELTKQSNQYMSELRQKEQDMAKIKPEDFWQDSSTAGKIGMSLAILAGGVSQGLARSGSNPAVESLKKVVAQDMQMYKAKVDHAMAGMDASGKLIDVVSKQIENAKVGAALRSVTINEQLKNNLDSLERQAGNDKARAEIAKIRAEVVQKQAQDVAKYEEAVQGSVKRDYQVRRMLANVAPESHAQLTEFKPAEQLTVLKAMDDQRTVAAELAGVNPATLPPIALPAKFTEGQQKAGVFVNQGEQDVYRLEDIEKKLAKSNPEMLNKMRVAEQSAINAMFSAEKGPSGFSISPGTTWAEVSAKLEQDISNAAEKAAPGYGADHARAMMSLGGDMTRLVSGASIKDSEQINTLLSKVFINPRLSPQGQADVFNARRNHVRGVKSAVDPGNQQRALYFDMPRK